MKQYPNDHQSLFEFAIDNKRRVINECSVTILHDEFRLWQWAREYAALHNLTAPKDPKVYGIYYIPDGDAIEELKAAGITLPPTWEYNVEDNNGADLLSEVGVEIRVVSRGKGRGAEE
jgi:hypothetical protein